MNLIRTKAFFISTALLFLTLSSVSFGQTNASEEAKMKEQLIGPWVIMIGKGPDELVLKIQTVTVSPEGGFALDAVYGSIGGSLGKVKVNLIKQDQIKKIVFTTGSKNQVDLAEATDGTFIGTFTNPTKGSVLPMKMEKVSDDVIRSKEAPFVAERRALAMAGPDPSVPQSCAAFFGEWTAAWKYEGGPKKLTIGFIRPDCTAKYSYSNTVSQSSLLAQITPDGVLKVPCGSVGRNCVFTIHGDKIWSSYDGPDFRNTGIFTKEKQ